MVMMTVVMVPMNWFRKLISNRTDDLILGDGNDLVGMATDRCEKHGREFWERTVNDYSLSALENRYNLCAQKLRRAI